MEMEPLARKLAFVFYAFLISFATQSFAEIIDASKAPFYVGKSVMVCGNVKQVSQHKQRVYINLTRAYPNEDIAFLIWNEDIPNFARKFGNLSSLFNKRVCGAGEITIYKEHLQMKLSNPSNLRLMKN